MALENLYGKIQGRLICKESTNLFSCISLTRSFSHSCVKGEAREQFTLVRVPSQLDRWPGLLAPHECNNDS